MRSLEKTMKVFEAMKYRWAYGQESETKINGKVMKLWKKIVDCDREIIMKEKTIPDAMWSCGCIVLRLKER